MTTQYSNGYVVSVMVFYAMAGFSVGGGTDMLTEMGKGIYFTVYALAAITFLILQIKELWVPMFTGKSNGE